MACIVNLIILIFAGLYQVIGLVSIFEGYLKNENKNMSS